MSYIKNSSREHKPAQAYNAPHYRRNTKRGKPPAPLGIAAAAAALVQAIKDRYGLQNKERIIVTRTWVGAFYSDESDGWFVRWRTEDEARRGIIPPGAAQ